MFDYCILPSTQNGREIGFTSDKFEGILWRQGDYIVISYITSVMPGCGNLTELFDNITKKGLGIKVPNPLPIMEQICKDKGFTWTQGPVEPGICNDIVNIYVRKKT